jgi:hypothetical protein
MKSKLYTLILLTGTFIFFSCKSASKLYDKGNYDEAVEVAAKKLQKKPDDAELQDLIRSAYRYAIGNHDANIRSFSNSTNELKWEWIHAEYAAMQRLYHATKNNITVSQIVNPVDYSSYLETYANKASDVRLERGDRWFSENTRQSFKNAYYEYRAANAFRPDTDTRIKMNEAYEEAVINVVVLPMRDNRYSYSYYNNNYTVRNLDEEVLNSLRNNPGNDFVRFYSEREYRNSNVWESTKSSIRADQFIDMRFNNFNIGRSRDDNSYRDVTKRIVVKETVYRPDSIVYEYKDVKARITTTKRRILSEGFLQLNVRDEDGRFLWSDEMRGEHNWYTEFATYTGDDRALSESDKQLVNRRADNPPHESEIFRSIINNIDNNIAGRLRSFYSRF